MHMSESWHLCGWFKKTGGGVGHKALSHCIEDKHNAVLRHIHPQQPVHCMVLEPCCSRAMKQCYLRYPVITPLHVIIDRLTQSSWRPSRLVQHQGFPEDSLPLHQSLTLLRSFVVTLSSSRQGIRWTNANIWYLALMNSVLLGLEITEGFELIEEGRDWTGSIIAFRRPYNRPHDTTDRQTHCTRSWGLALRFPLPAEDGSRRLCSQIELAPLPYRVWTIYNKKAKELALTLPH